jgi:hypothetical protein
MISSNQIFDIAILRCCIWHNLVVAAPAGPAMPGGAAMPGSCGALVPFAP